MKTELFFPKFIYKHPIIFINIKRPYYLRIFINIFSILFHKKRAHQTDAHLGMVRIKLDKS